MTALGDFSSGDVLTAADLNAIGTWSDFTPNLRPSTGSYTSTVIYSAKFAKINDVVIGLLIYKITNVGTGSGAVVFDLPTTDADYSVSTGGSGIGYGRENQLNGYVVQVFRHSSTSAAVQYYDAFNPSATNHGAGVTFIYRSA